MPQPTNIQKSLINPLDSYLSFVALLHRSYILTTGNCHTTNQKIRRDANHRPTSLSPPTNVGSENTAGARSRSHGQGRVPYRECVPSVAYTTTAWHEAQSSACSDQASHCVQAEMMTESLIMRGMLEIARPSRRILHALSDATSANCRRVFVRGAASLR